MAQKGIGYFDSRGQYFKTADEATISDIAVMLGRIGEGESLADGIAHLVFEKRVEIERLFKAHDDMVANEGRVAPAVPVAIYDDDGKVTRLPHSH